jgi:chromosome segregation ATPase
MITKTLNVPDESASVTQDPFSDGRAVPGYDSPVRRLNDSGDVPVSDWDDVISSGQENEFRQKAEFFGPHVSSVIQSAMDNHFRALEKRFNDLIEEQLTRVQKPSRRARSRITVDSDADDEDDDVETDAYSRGFSPKRDRRMEKFKVMLQEALAANRPRTPLVQDLSHFENLQRAISDIQGSITQKSEIPAPAIPTLAEMKAMIEESIVQQNEALVRRRENAIKAEDEERFHEFADRLKDAATRIAAETEARSEAERREAETNHLLKITEEELMLLKEAARDDSARLRALEEATQSAKAAKNDADNAHADMSKKLMNLTVKNETLNETLEEYRLSSDKWRRDIEDAHAEKEKIHAAFGALKTQAEEALRIRETMRSRIEKLQDNMNHAAGQVAAERAKWSQSDAEHRTRYEILAARAEAEARTRERFERELERLETQERESYKLKAALEHEQKENVKLDKECERLASSLKELHAVKLELVQTQKENTRLEELVEQLKSEAIEHQKTADQYAREYREAREAGRLEVDRTRGLLQIDIENANNQVNIVRADLDAEITRLRTDLDNLKFEADTLRAKHELDLKQAADSKRDALQELRDAKDATFEELRYTFEERFEELRKQHRRDLDHTIENKNQSETFLRDSHAQQLQDLQDHQKRALEQALNEKEFSESQLNERLSLAGSKIEHLQDKVLHMEEKLEMAKSAAHAAAQAAQSAKSPAVSQGPILPATAPAEPRLPEKISPQALRESIAVLQEQLQEREGRIEGLEQELSEVDKEAPAKLKAKDTEIGWLRELIGVRIDDLSDLVNVLSRADFDREAVRNAAIRIRASIQMEQDAKERLINGSASFPTLASIQNFASPKAAQLAAAIGNWRRGGGGVAPSSLSQSVSSLSSSRTQTPSKPVTTAQNFLNGLMTPPASNLRKTPSPDSSLGASRPRPLNPHHSEPRPLGSRSLEKRRMSHESEVFAVPSTPPLLKGADYDQDAEESTTGYYDDEESTVEGTPRAERMRALEPFGPEVDR